MTHDASNARWEHIIGDDQAEATRAIHAETDSTILLACAAALEVGLGTRQQRDEVTRRNLLISHRLADVLRTNHPPTETVL